MDMYDVELLSSTSEASLVLLLYFVKRQDFYRGPFHKAGHKYNSREKINRLGL